MLSLLVVLLTTPAAAVNERQEEAIERAADVICGETGRDDYMATHVAYVIWNRMRSLPGTRAEKIIKVLTKRNAFAGSCRKHGRTPTEWDVYLARTLADGNPDKLVVRPWMNERVLRFTDRKEPCHKRKNVKKRGKNKKAICRNTADRWVIQGHRVVGRIGNMNFYEE
jgi:hypothetical protein